MHTPLLKVIIAPKGQEFYQKGKNGRNPTSIQSDKTTKICGRLPPILNQMIIQNEPFINLSATNSTKYFTLNES